ncbi:MAG: type II toxin-antitoxin system VapC family toxin [Gammaproteobacteria bacterium]|nr:type II toxin-antitoxin system VapC family toxin [Gammaproteobacteria bacterium]
MKLLLDTHALLWWLDGDDRLSRISRELLAEESNLALVSAASAWEIATKVRIGKLPGAVEVAERFVEVVKAQDFGFLSISAEHAQRAGLLPGEHRDPFDRMLIAQAQVEGLALVSNEKLFDQFGVRRIW